MNYTSGTTGNPKGIYRKLLGTTPTNLPLVWLASSSLSIQPQDDNVHIIGSPLYHTAVLRFGSASLHLGHTIVLMDKWTPEGMLQLIEEHKVTTSHMVPTQFHLPALLPEEVRNKCKYDMSSLRHMIHAAAPCPIDVKHKMIDWWGDAVDEYYAASEGGGTLVTAEEWLQKPGTVGKPWPISGRLASSTTMATGSPSPTSSAPSIWPCRDSRSNTTATKRRPTRTASATSLPWAMSACSTRMAISSCKQTARST